MKKSASLWGCYFRFLGCFGVVGALALAVGAIEHYVFHINFDDRASRPHLHAGSLTMIPVGVTEDALVQQQKGFPAEVFYEPDGTEVLELDGWINVHVEFPDGRRGYVPREWVAR